MSSGNIDLEALKTNEDIDQMQFELDKLPGVWIWTAEMTMLRGMQKLNSLPADDIGLQRVVSHYYFEDRRISSDEVKEVALG